MFNDTKGHGFRDVISEADLKSPKLGWCVRDCVVVELEMHSVASEADFVRHARKLQKRTGAVVGNKQWCRH